MISGLFYVSRLQNTANFKKGVDILASFRDQVAPYGQGLKENLNKSMLEIMKAKKALNTTEGAEQLKYIEEKTK